MTGPDPHLRRRGVRAEPAASREASTYTIEGQSFVARAPSPGLHLVATPIGNLGDITLRALGALAGADLIACEDTRITGRLLNHFGITTPLFPYHDHNAASARPKLLARLGEGRSIALVSDAGTPLVSDPGYKLVRAAQDAGHKVTCVPGPSSVLAALSIAGLPTDRFLFEGFLPAKDAARRSRIAGLERIPATLVLFESGPRLPEALAALADILGAREAAVCRELTKLYEEARRGTLPILADHYASAGPPKGEIVLVIAPPSEAAMATDAELDTMIDAARRRLSLKDAVAEVALASGRARNDIYRLALARERMSE